uniref:Candidate secreted effector n=2 Tax=Meloidogyne TaxID=189290 RepID=A0A914M3J6_MELIC
MKEYADITTIMVMVVMAGEAMVVEAGGLGMVGDGEMDTDMDITDAVKNNFLMKNILNMEEI